MSFPRFVVEFELSQSLNHGLPLPPASELAGDGRGARPQAFPSPPAGAGWGKPGAEPDLKEITEKMLH